MNTKKNNVHNRQKFQVNAFPKDKFFYPKVSELKTKHTYALTISPLPQEGIVSSYMDFQNIILTKLTYSKVIFKLRPELSHKNGNLHYHGTIYFPHIQSIGLFYYSVMQELKTVCTFTIIEITDHDDDDAIASSRWYLYCIKDRHINKPFFIEHLCLPYKITNKTRLLNPKKHVLDYC